MLAGALPRLPLQDRLNLVNDSWALALAGRSPATDYLAFTGHLSLSDGLVVWNQVIAHLNYTPHGIN
jgi:hypothetical protein